MKNILVLALSLSASLSYSSNIETLMRCVRADGGESPVIKYSTDYRDRFVLSDGSNVGWGDDVVPAYVRRIGSTYTVDGVLSAKFSLRKTRQQVEFTFDLSSYDSFIKKWLEANSDLLNTGSRYLYRKALFNCKITKY